MSDAASWKLVLSDKRFQIHLIISGVSAIFLISFLPYFFNDILFSRPGILLNDIVLNQLEPRNWSWFIFGIIYMSVLLTVFSNYSKPFIILLGIESYIALNLVRLVTLYLVTLSPPRDIIPLIDPVITKIAYGDHVYLKDLFFSGHVSTLFLLFLIEKKKLTKIFLLTSTLAVAFLILWQHVHYTVDVLLAPLFSWAIYYVIKKIHARHFPNTREAIPHTDRTR
jgi:hypothetical protein